MPRHGQDSPEAMRDVRAMVALAAIAGLMVLAMLVADARTIAQSASAGRSCIQTCVDCPPFCAAAFVPPKP